MDNRCTDTLVAADPQPAAVDQAERILADLIEQRRRLRLAGVEPELLEANGRAIAYWRRALTLASHRLAREEQRGYAA